MTRTHRGPVLRRIVLVLTVLAPLMMVGPASAAVRDGRGIGGLGDITTCFRDSRHLVVSIVVDESASLLLTDPEGERVDAVLTAIDGLAELRESTEGAEVDVTIGVFGDPFVPLLPFTPVDEESMEELRDVARTLEDRREGTETDLVTALADAHEQLADHASEITALGGDEPCALILLFTDGGYNLELRGRASSPDSTTKFYAPDEDLFDPEGLTNAMDAGVDALCREGGIMDGIRADGITVMSVMLEKEGFEDIADPDLLRALTLGDAGERTCGRPSENVRGTYVVAADADLLLAGFHELATRLNGGVVTAGDPAIVVCDDDDCDSGTRSIEVDPLSHRLRVLGLTPQSDLEIRIDGPAGRATVTEDGDVSLGDVTGRARRVAGRGFSIDLDRPDDLDDWAGTWTFTVVADDGEPDTPGLLQLYTYTDLGLVLEVGELIRGEAGEVTAMLDLPEEQDGEAFIEAAVVVARFEDPLTGRAYVVDLVGPTGGPFTGVFDVPADLRSAGLRAGATIDVEYGSGGAASAASGEQLVAVARPGGALQFSPPELEWPTLSRDGRVSTTLVAEAGDEGGCVWFDPPDLTAPDEAGTLTVTFDGHEIVDESSCIEVEAGTTRDIEIELTAESRATGSLRGSLTVHENAGEEATTTDVFVSGRFHRGIDQARRVLAAAVLIVAGLLLPIGLLYLVNTIGARFQRLDAVRAAVLPVRVTGREIVLLEANRSRRLTVYPDQFESLADRGDARDFEFGDIRFRPRPSRNPFGPTRALAVPVGGAQRLRGRVGSRVELDASLAGSWVFLLDPDATRRGLRNSADGRLIAFIHETADVEAHQRLQRDIEQRLPETAAALAKAVRDETSS